MTIFILYVGALVTAWVQHDLAAPWWIWIVYAACGVWALVVDTVRRQEQTMAFHAVMDIREKLAEPPAAVPSHRMSEPVGRG